MAKLSKSVTVKTDKNGKITQSIFALKDGTVISIPGPATVKAN